MSEQTSTDFHFTLYAGDALAILVAVLIGLRFHDAESGLIGRVLYNWLPWLLAWLAAGLPLGIFSGQKQFGWGKIGRVLWAAMLAAPLSAVLRAAWLGSAALPVFVLVMGAVAALAVIIWRFAYFLWAGRKGA